MKGGKCVTKKSNESLPFCPTAVAKPETKSRQTNISPILAQRTLHAQRD